MRITVTARHVDIDPALRAHAVELVEKVAKLARRPHHAQVVFFEEAEAGTEITLHIPRGKVCVARGLAPDHRSALDLAIARLKRQLLAEKTPPRPRRAASSRTTVRGRT